METYTLTPKVAEAVVSNALELILTGLFMSGACIFQYMIELHSKVIYADCY